MKNQIIFHESIDWNTFSAAINNLAFCFTLPQTIYYDYSLCRGGWKHNSFWIIVTVIVLDVQNWIAKDFKVPASPCGKLSGILNVWNHCCSCATWSFSYTETSEQNSPFFFLIFTITAVWSCSLVSKNSVLKDYFGTAVETQLWHYSVICGLSFCPLLKRAFFSDLP